jgi:predicted O-methyltransferase YrrM
MLMHDQFVAEAAKIPYQNRHSFFLYALVKWLRPEVVVEVGTHIGISAVWMARGLQENAAESKCTCGNSGEPSCCHCCPGQLECIDSFCWVEERQQEQWTENIDRCGVRNSVSLLEGRSQAVKWPDHVDMAFIDGNHDYEVCSWDVEKARSLGATCIALHDTVQCEGTRRLSEEMRQVALFANFDFLEVNFDAGLLVAVKREPKGPVTDFKDQWDKR